jgi:hypothetical protein
MHQRREQTWTTTSCTRTGRAVRHAPACTAEQHRLFRVCSTSHPTPFGLRPAGQARRRVDARRRPRTPPRRYRRVRRVHFAVAREQADLVLLARSCTALLTATPLRRAVRTRQRCAVTASGRGTATAATSASGSPLCQDAAWSAVVGSVMAGPGSDLSEEPVRGCEPATLDSVAVPRCPPGPVIARIASSTMCR